MAEERFGNCETGCGDAFDSCCDKKKGWKKEPKKDCECNLCEKIHEDDWVFILTKHNNFILGRVDKICEDTLKLERSFALPSCVICEFVAAILAPVGGGAPAILGNGFDGLSPFDTVVCCEDIDTITKLPDLSCFANSFGAIFSAKK